MKQLPTRMVEKVWGRDVLPSPFAAPVGKRIGEIWFEPPPEMPSLLVKYLFTSEKLSVQVHPSTEDALPGENGKEECWLVLDAEPGAQLAIGFDQMHTPDAIEQAARDGSIERLLTWHDAKAGDVFFLPAGTVHAIGPGLSLVEVQQNSDTTFRLYDYGRPRELHLERAMAVADVGPYASKHRRTAMQRGSTLIDAANFRLDRVENTPDDIVRQHYPADFLALPLKGCVQSVDGGLTVGPGECLHAAGIDLLDFSAAEVTLLTRST